MIRIIDGKKYNTETANRCGIFRNDESDLDYIYEELHQKRTGEFFLYGEGGARTNYAKKLTGNNWASGCKIVPLTYAEAREWAESKLSPEEYQKIFEISEADECNSEIRVRVSGKAVAILKNLSAKWGCSITEAVDKIINNVDI